ncbi:hypothetical protein BC938DRAFT_482715 [Jimgerdemannia flammicorona]|uniref:Uncharacterized protein n=1 Tax=Jimgerdemannia flammicorona TaxID=994334 RepID=A0A433QDI1_9FUNG|nr:hypothetical protein BC938DRAFT_482715 [Jimgerdemannia flammicorona]
MIMGFMSTKRVWVRKSYPWRRLGSRALGPTSPIIRGNPQPARATKTAMTRRKNRCCGLLISQQHCHHQVENGHQCRENGIPMAMPCPSPPSTKPFW